MTQFEVHVYIFLFLCHKITRRLFYTFLHLILVVFYLVGICIGNTGEEAVISFDKSSCKNLFHSQINFNESKTSTFLAKGAIYLSKYMYIAMTFLSLDFCLELFCLCVNLIKSKL